MAMTGAVLGNRCLPSQADANDAYYSGMAPALTAGSPGYLSEFVKVGGVWQVQQYSVSGGATTLVGVSDAPVLALPACDPAESFKDGHEVGWGIATAMVVAGCLKLMARAAS